MFQFDKKGLFLAVVGWVVLSGLCLAQPTVSFSPSDGATDVNVNTVIVIDFDEAIRNVDDSEIDDDNVESLISLKTDNVFGTDVPFTATINAGKTSITLTPGAPLDNDQVYYVSITSIENSADVATGLQAITFTSTDDITPPVPSFSPANAATAVPPSASITITFDEPVRNIDNSALDNTSIDARITLKLTNAAGADIPFDATINAGKTVITIIPSAALPDLTTIYVAISNVEDEFDNAVTTASVTFETGDSSPPTITFTPADGAISVPVNTAITITADKAIRFLDDSEITNANVASLITLKKNNSGGPDVAFTATINAGKTTISITPDSNLDTDATYYVGIASIESTYGVSAPAADITFSTIDTQPPVPTFSPADGATGVNNSANIVITFNEPIRNLNNVALNNATIGSKIVLKIGDASGPNIPFDAVIDVTATEVTINPQIVLPDLTDIYVSINNVEDSSDNGITTPISSTFTTTDGTPPVVTINPVNGSGGFPISGNIVITFDEPVRLTNNSPITNANVGGLITFIRTSNSSNVSFTATINAAKTEITIDPSSNLAADVEYSVTLAAIEDLYNNQTGPHVSVFTTQSMTVNAGTNKTICSGESVAITASVSGGSGFYSFQWTSLPAGFNSSSQTITVSPTVTTTYTCIVTDSDGNSNSGTPATVTVTVNATPIASWNPGTKQSFIVNESPYLLSGTATNQDGVTPSVGTNTFSGAGVTLHGDGNYYFHPNTTGIASDLPLTYTHTNSAGCSDSDEILVSVSSESPILNLQDGYCSNEGINMTASGILAPNPAVVSMGTYSHMAFWTAYNTPVAGPLVQVGTSPATYRLDPQLAAAALNGAKVFYIAVYAQFSIPLGVPLTLPVHVVEVNLYLPGIQPVITSIRSSEIMCESNPPLTLTTSTGTSYTTVSWSVVSYPYMTTETPNGITETSPDVFEFNPGAITYPANEPYKYLAMIYRYHDTNGCLGEVTEPFITVRKPAPPIAEDKQYCQFYEGDLTLAASGEFNYIKWYENENLSDPDPALTSIFNTNLNSSVPQSKDYWVTDDYFGYCQSNPTKVTIQITPVPQFTLSTPAQCEGKEFSFQGPNGADSYEWLIERGGPNGEDVIYNDQNPVHTYTHQGLYNVRLRITYTSNSNECATSDGTQVTVGVNPEPTFTYAKLCDEDFTEFTGIVPAGIGVERFSWDFGDGNVLPEGNSGASVPAGTHGGNTTNTYKDPRHRFINTSVPATYDVTVTAVTNLGCSGSATKSVTLLPYLTANPQTPYSMRDIDNGRGYWTVEDINGNSTWVFDQPDKAFIRSNESAWVTHATANYLADDKSYVNSPCFDITGFTKPVVALDYITDTERSYDGAVLEYSNDGGTTWTALGNTVSGADWFNTQGFLTGNIGSSQVGWSGQLWTDNDSYGWMQGRHKLDNIENKSKVRFRIAFASNSTGEFEGFAFNNFSIRERNRNILIENFTNQQFTANNNYYAAIPESEAVKIQYHVGFPADDDNFRVNPTDPAARAAYYGIPLQNEYIPRAFVDGMSQGNLTTPWETQYRDLRSLASAPFLINLSVNPSDGELLISAKAQVLEAFPANDRRKPVLHIVVVEKTVGTNRYVVRKMLPNATGTILPLPMADGTTTENITVSWRVSNAVDRSDLAVIAFIQDEVTHEVYQSAIETSIADPGIVTAIEETLLSGLSVYPNPADHGFTIQLREAAPEEYPVRMIDSFGRRVYESPFRKGEQSKEVRTETLAAGMYFVQIETGQGVVWRKVMIGH